MVFSIGDMLSVMDGSPLNSLTIQGFKSIHSLESFKLEPLNVLIGANGAGKSNFVEFFQMLRALSEERFQGYVKGRGGGDGFFYLGPKVTPKISARLEFGLNTYAFELTPSVNNSLLIASESVEYKFAGKPQIIGQNNKESQLKDRSRDKGAVGRHNRSFYVYQSVSSWTVYHFHDTSLLSPMRRDQSARDDERFRHDASNIAAFLLKLKENSPAYELIRDNVRLIAPYFDDFILRPRKLGENEVVRLEWTQKGSDFPFQPSQLSDGTLRFICLATALLQPQPPATIIIDEPELGLHPYAIAILADLMKSVSQRRQVIVSTQAPTLVDHFDPGDIIVVDRVEGQSTFERLNAVQLKDWLTDYSIGELWQKNLIRGGPGHE